jgi:ribosomal protein S13
VPIKIIKIMKRKLILTESQYNRIFNSKKRKLVITESQYNTLLSEIELKNNLVVGDILKFIWKRPDDDDDNGSEMILKVVYRVSDQIFMVDCAEWISKQYIYKLVDYSKESLKINVIITRIDNNDDEDIKKVLENNSDDGFKLIFNLSKEPEILKGKSDEYKCKFDAVLNVFKNPETEDDIKIELKNNLVGGDILKVTLKSDVEQILKIVDGFSDQIFMIDCNNAIDKNYIYKLIDYSEENLKINTLRVHIKHIDDIKKYKNGISDKKIWKPYAFNLLKEPEILKDKADEYKCTLDDVINVYKNPETEDDDNVSDKPDVKDGDMKVDIVKRLKSDIFNALDKNEWVRIEFSDGSYVNVKIIDKQGSNVIIEFDEKDGVIKTYKGKAEEFVKPIRQFLQKLNKFNTISIDINKMTNFEKKINEQEVDDSDLKFDVPISITYDIDGNDEVKKFPLNNVYGINKTSKKEDSEDEDMSDEEFREYIKNNEFIKNIVLKKPGVFVRFLGNYRGKGLKAAEDAIRKFKTDIKSKKDTGDYPGKEFETGKIITGQLTQFNDLITIYENFKLKVGKLNISKDSKIKLWSNINNDSYDINGNNAKYKFLIGKKIEDNLYRVEILERKEKTNEKRKIINSTLKIIDYGKKK